MQAIKQDAWCACETNRMCGVAFAMRNGCFSQLCHYLTAILTLSLSGKEPFLLLLAALSSHRASPQHGWSSLCMGFRHFSDSSSRGCSMSDLLLNNLGSAPVQHEGFRAGNAAICGAAAPIPLLHRALHYAKSQLLLSRNPSQPSQPFSRSCLKQTSVESRTVCLLLALQLCWLPVSFCH